MAIRAEDRGKVGLVLLDRPEKAHAYDRTHLLALREAFGRMAADRAVVVVASAGQRAFCGGADLGEVAAAGPLAALDLLSQRVFAEIAESGAVSIAAVQGPAVAGGCELALACDLRVVGPRASFSLPETGRGLIPAAGGCTRLTRLVGPSVAKAVILGGRQISASDAVSWGLAVEQADDPLEAALALGERIAGRDALALRLAKQVIDQGGSLGMERVAEALLYTRKG